MKCFYWVLCCIFVSSNATLVSAQVDDWQKCCGAVCLKVAAGIHGYEYDLDKIRRELKPDSNGKVSLFRLEEVAEKLGFPTTAYRVEPEKLELLRIPLIAYVDPEHFVVLFGLGKGKGVLYIDPPRRARVVQLEKLSKQLHWNVLVVRHPTQNQADGLKGERPIQVRPLLGASEDADIVAIHPREWDWGTLDEGARYERKIDVKNISAQNVKLTRLVTGCSCLNIESKKLSLAPGEHTVVTLTIDTTGMNGFFQRRAYIHAFASRSKQSQNLLINVWGSVSANGKIVITPQRIDIGDILLGEEKRTFVKLRRSGGGKFLISRVETEHSFITAKVSGNSSEKRPEAILEVAVAPDQPIGKFASRLAVLLADGVEDTGQLWVNGNVVGSLGVKPERVFLSTSGSSEAVLGIVTVWSRTGSNIEIREVSIDIPEIEPHVRKSSGKQGGFQVLLTAIKSMRPGILRGTLSIQLTGSSSINLKVPVIGYIPTSALRKEFRSGEG